MKIKLYQIIQGTIQSLEVTDRTVTEYFQETKKCKVLIKLKILKVSGITLQVIISLHLICLKMSDCQNDL